MKQKKLAEPSPAEDNNTLESSSLTKEKSQSPAVKGDQSDEAENRSRGTIPGLDEYFGSNSTEVVILLLWQLRNVFPGAGPDDRIEHIAFVVLGGIGPRDQLEELLAVQMLGTHNLAMQFLARAALKEQTVDGVNMNVDRATKLLRTFAMQMEALKRHRSEGEQRVIVKHVNVHEGGQAIVGAVSHNSKGGGGNGQD
jgi:hypothetical protein